ncbi:Fe2+-dependent dioxygenase [Sphingomonas nostoxanthinifaciens]|uniref:Fe2+-dependent dioxygenase n=1 Tax=Sphingomonas nostoxanthinifaciens TaxID=2872652 RepID=UPI001CC1D38D|nr:Fe2+-dependent dioxygenase [Sphingomonas nostoxanthinifaciens]UAK25050.1 Fe2+-dependent dioxygenase [Sphingomonas nostoxanthinifaciens]
MLLSIPDLLTPDEVRDARALLEAAAWEDGRTTAGHRAVTVKSNLQLPLDHPVARQLGDLILDRLGRNPLFIAATLPLRVLPPRFNRYEGGGTYGSHVDSAIFPLPGSQQRVRSDISSTLFFSDPDSYEGGELVIEDLFGTQRVKLPAGHIVIYPGSSLHHVTPVTRGVRLAAFFWTQSMVQRDDQRRLLFELDNAVRDLTGDHPEHAALDRLTGVYHNLLRQWSTT